MERERQQPAAAAAASKVQDDDLLAEILLRVALPTTLLRAALVCKRWLGHASGRAFLRRFHKRHPPRLLGFYVEGDRDVPADPPAFVPVLPQPAELAAAVRRASFSFDIYRGQLVQIHDCRNGSVFVQVGSEGRAVMRVHTPLCPQRRVAFIPPFPRPALRPRGLCSFTQILSTEESGGLSYHYLYVESTVDKPETRHPTFPALRGDHASSAPPPEEERRGRSRRRRRRGGASRAAAGGGEEGQVAPRRSGREGQPPPEKRRADVAGGEEGRAVPSLQ